MTNRTTEIDLENEEFQQAYRLLKDSNANVFLTGRAGTGKSTFLRYLCQHLQKKYVVLAPTGVAAVNVGGVTIHSFFQMPLRPVPPDDPDYSVGSFKKTQKFSRQKRKLLRELELIIIDEVSMVRPDMIDFIDRVLRGVTGRRGKPFGGVQLLLVGDIFQLEPVVNADTRLILSKYYDDFFFFNAKAYNSTNLVSIELKKIYRQSDPSFIGILDRVRNNSVTYEDVALLNRNVINKKCEDISDADFGITLTSRRDIASNINRDKMESLPGEEFIFKGEINDDFPEKLLPTDLNLVLKKDAQVMLIRNDKDRRWVNGTLAKITEISQTSITVKLENGNEEKVEREIWSNITYTYDEKEKKVKEEILGTFVQFPLRAAWALTIHKSQGLTFNNVAIDMGAGAFSAGQTYVALSRCRTLEGIQFINPIKRGDVIVSKGARSFSKGFNDTQQTEMVLRRAKASRLSKEAKEKFGERNFKDSIELLWEIHELTGGLSAESVRRFISGKLSIISQLESELKRQKEELKNLSKEFCEMAIASKEDIAMSKYYFSKAYSIDSENMSARIGIAECLIAEGNAKEALKILDEVVKKDKKSMFRCMMLKGMLLENENDLAGAVLSYTSAMKKDKNAKEPVLKIIDLYEEAGMEEEAQKYKEWLEEKFP